MRIIDRTNRPVVEFDPSNAQHRVLFRTFIKTRKWAHSPLRFALRADYLDLHHYLNTVLLDWYMNQDKNMIDKVA